MSTRQCLNSVDITERKRVEKELLEKERRLIKAEEIAHLGSWELDVVNNKLTWSDETYRIFGLKPQQFKATYEAFLAAVHPDDRKAVDATYLGSLKKGEDCYEIEHRVVRKSTGEIRYVHEKCEHIRDKSGKVIRSFGMVHDITEAKKAEEVLREIDRRKDEFINVASHELKTPLTSIKLYLDLWKKRLENEKSEKGLYFWNKLNEQTNKFQRLANDLLDVSRASLGKLSIIKTKFDLSELVRKTCVDYQLRIKTHSIKCDLTQGIRVYGDETRIGQVLNNLFDNAIKYSPGYDKIIVKLTQDKKEAIVSVKDFGLGINAKNQEKIFDRYFREENDSKISGFGLGLYVAQEIVKSHGGKLWLKSEPAKGSTFFFSLPV